MKIGIISDTHDNTKAIEDGLNILEKEGVEMIIHCGDAISPFSIAKFANKNATYVIGNNEGEIIGLLNMAKKSGINIEVQPAFLEINGKSIVVIHGSGSPEKTNRHVEALAKSGEFDLVVYGHTHVPVIKVIGRALVINPGEASGVLYGKRSVAIADLEKMEAKIIEF